MKKGTSMVYTTLTIEQHCSYKLKFILYFKHLRHIWTIFLITFIFRICRIYIISRWFQLVPAQIQGPWRPIFCPKKNYIKSSISAKSIYVQCLTDPKKAPLYIIRKCRWIFFSKPPLIRLKETNNRSSLSVW